MERQPKKSRSGLFHHILGGFATIGEGMSNLINASPPSLRRRSAKDEHTIAEAWQEVGDELWDSMRGRPTKEQMDLMQERLMERVRQVKEG